MYTCTCSGCIHCLHPKSLRLQFANAAPWRCSVHVWRGKHRPTGGRTQRGGSVACYQRLGRSHCFVSSYVLSRKDQRWSKIKDFFTASCLKHIDTKDTCSCLWRNTAMIAAVHHLNWDLVSSDSGLYPSTLINWGRLSAQP